MHPNPDKESRHDRTQAKPQLEQEAQAFASATANHPYVFVYGRRGGPLGGAALRAAVNGKKIHGIDRRVAVGPNG
jgi:hypothetical protein